MLLSVPIELIYEIMMEYSYLVWKDRINQVNREYGDRYILGEYDVLMTLERNEAWKIRHHKSSSTYLDMYKNSKWLRCDKFVHYSYGSANWRDLSCNGLDRKQVIYHLSDNTEVGKLPINY